MKTGVARIRSQGRTPRRYAEVFYESTRPIAHRVVGLLACRES
jgi:hypothetical protein